MTYLMSDLTLLPRTWEINYQHYYWNREGKQIWSKINKKKTLLEALSTDVMSSKIFYL